jgi:hypothetical protein
LVFLIRYVSGLTFIRYVSGLTFIRYAQSQQNRRPNNLEVVGSKKKSFGSRKPFPTTKSVDSPK